jgi:phosphoadenosine phosphosulfate reductase
MNPLYAMGYSRVGCIGCPMATYKQKMKEFHDFPKYERLYKNAFKKMLEEKSKEGKSGKGYTWKKRTGCI